MQSLIILLVFITSAIVIYGIINALFIKMKYINRLKAYLNMKQFSPKNTRKIKKTMRFLPVIGRRVGGLGIFKGYKDKIQAQLTKAHIPLKGEEFITLSLCITIAAVILFSIAFNNLGLGLLMGLVAWFIPALIVNTRKKRRLKVLNDQLGDGITLISNSLKAGYSFFQAVDTISTEMSGSISEEFSQLKKEMNLGITTEDALDNLVKRAESDDLELVVTAILIQRQVGGNLAEILDSISETIRERVRIKGEVKTLTAQGRMSGIIISLIPMAVGLLLFVINPEYITLLFKDKIGLIMLGLSAAMELMGIYFISKIVKIEV